MNRREFLKRSAGALLGLAVAAYLPAVGVSAKASLQPLGTSALLLGRLLVGTPQGLILESLDGGETWQQIASFGAHCQVVDLTERHGQLLARIGLAGHSFVLSSPDLRTWRTTDYV